MEVEIGAKRKLWIPDTARARRGIHRQAEQDSGSSEQHPWQGHGPPQGGQWFLKRDCADFSQRATPGANSHILEDGSAGQEKLLGTRAFRAQDGAAAY